MDNDWLNIHVFGFIFGDFLKVLCDSGDYVLNIKLDQGQISLENDSL